MLFLLFAFVSSVLFGTCRIFDRKGLMGVDIGNSLLYTLGSGFLILFSLSLISGDLALSTNYSLASIGYAAISGVLAFVLGRFLFFASIRIIGATRASVMASTQIIVASTLSIVFLGERMSSHTLLGTSLTFIGLILTSLSTSEIDKKEQTHFGKPHTGFRKGYFFGLMCGMSYGATTVLAKEALSEIGSPIMVTLIGCAFAILLALPTIKLMAKKELAKHKLKPTGFIVSGGILRTFAALSRYAALGLAPVVLVAPIVALSPVFTLVFSHFAIRKIEAINKRAIFGVLVSVSGAIIVATSAY